jgi:hypothetical protein
MRQCATTRKNRKVRVAQELHGVVITILYKCDPEAARDLAARPT